MTLCWLYPVAPLAAGAPAACGAPDSRANVSAGVDVKVGGAGIAGAPCFVEADGRRLSAEAFAAASRGWRGREVHLRGEAGTPYRCMGPVIYQLQSAGIDRIGFISEPDTPQSR